MTRVIQAAAARREIYITRSPPVRPDRPVWFSAEKGAAQDRPKRLTRAHVAEAVRGRDRQLHRG